MVPTGTVITLGLNSLVITHTSFGPGTVIVVGGAVGGVVGGTIGGVGIGICGGAVGRGVGVGGGKVGRGVGVGVGVGVVVAGGVGVAGLPQAPGISNTPISRDVMRNLSRITLSLIYILLFNSNI